MDEETYIERLQSIGRVNRIGRYGSIYGEIYDSYFEQLKNMLNEYYDRRIFTKIKQKPQPTYKKRILVYD